MKSPLHSAHLDTPIGRIVVVVDDRALVGIGFDDAVTEAGSLEKVPRVVSATEQGAAHRQPGVLGRVMVQLQEYFDGRRRRFDVPLAPQGSDFQQRCWGALTEIPFGETISYGEQADRIGDRNKARAVGAANAKNPIPIVIPCHRVVGANGALTGFAGGVHVKAWLLEHENAQTRLRLERCVTT